MKILLVEDDAEIAQLIQETLERESFLCELAKDGLAALENFQRLEPDVIILDVNMKPVNGLEAIRQIRADLPSARILVLTVSEEERVLTEALQSGANGYLLKNLDIQELLKMLMRTISGLPAISTEMADRVVGSFI